MDKKEFVEQLKVALRNDKLVTPKHDPNNLGQITYPSYRSVLSYELARNLEEVITSENYDAIEYKNLDPKHQRQELIEMVFPDNAFSVPASGVAADSSIATEALDQVGCSLEFRRNPKDFWRKLSNNRSQMQEWPTGKERKACLVSSQSGLTVKVGVANGQIAKLHSPRCTRQQEGGACRMGEAAS